MPNAVSTPLRVLGLGLPLLGCASVASAGDLVVDGAWSRGTVAGATGVIYMTIRNTGATADRLVGVSSPVAHLAEMHESRSAADGMVTMAAVPAVAIPPHGEVAFMPRGLHVMLLDLGRPLSAGQRFSATLTFEHAGVVAVSVEVLKAGARSFEPMGGMKM